MGKGNNINKPGNQCICKKKIHLNSVLLFIINYLKTQRNIVGFNVPVLFYMVARLSSVPRKKYKEML